MFESKRLHLNPVYLFLYLCSDFLVWAVIIRLNTESLDALIASSVNWRSVNYQKLRMRRSLVKLSGLVKSVIPVVTGCLRLTEVAIFVVWYWKVFKLDMKNIGLCLHMFDQKFCSSWCQLNFTPHSNICSCDHIFRSNLFNQMQGKNIFTWRRTT